MVDVRGIRDFSETVTDNIEKVIVGKRDVIELVMAALLCEGHLLFEDMPGTGKTMLARAVAVSLGLDFHRIQFTPDLLPNDVVGVSIFNQQTLEFEFRPGPAFSHILLTDEINRATPRTQSALLEAMGEHQISVDGVSRTLPRPFLVMATQNPIEYEGTFPLPEAQLDRFFMRLSLGYASAEDERTILHNLEREHPIESLEQVVDGRRLLQLQQAVWDVHVDDTVRDYLIGLVQATREHDELILGASTRGTIGLFKAVQAYAALQERDYVIPDDVKRLAVCSLAHRLIVKPESALRGRTADSIVGNILERETVTLNADAAQADGG